MPRGGKGGLACESSGKPWTGATSVFGTCANPVGCMVGRRGHMRGDEEGLHADPEPKALLWNSEAHMFPNRRTEGYRHHWVHVLGQ